MTTKEALIALLAERYPECSVAHGWILDGAGPARHGWARRAATGRLFFLGKTAADALAKLREEPPRTVGRPTLGEGDTVRIALKLPAASRDRWQAAAERQGQTLSDWLREAGELAVTRGSTR